MSAASGDASVVGGMKDRKTSYGSLSSSFLLEKKYSSVSLGIRPISSWVLNKAPTVSNTLKPKDPKPEHTESSGFAALKAISTARRTEIDADGHVWVEYETNDTGSVFYYQQDSTVIHGQWQRPDGLFEQDPLINDELSSQEGSYISVEAVDFTSLDEALISRPFNRSFKGSSLESFVTNNSNNNNNSSTNNKNDNNIDNHISNSKAAAVVVRPIEVTATSHDPAIERTNLSLKDPLPVNTDPISSNKDPIKDPISSNKDPNKDPISSNKDPISSNKDPISTNKDPISSSKDPISTNKDPNKDPISSSKDPISSSKDPISTNKDPISTNKDPISSSKDPISTNKDSNKDPITVDPVPSDKRIISTSANNKRTVLGNEITNQTSTSINAASTKKPLSKVSIINDNDDYVASLKPRLERKPLFGSFINKVYTDSVAMEDSKIVTAAAASSSSIYSASNQHLSMMALDGGSSSDDDIDNDKHKHNNDGDDDNVDDFDILDVDAEINTTTSVVVEGASAGGSANVINPFIDQGSIATASTITTSNGTPSINSSSSNKKLPPRSGLHKVC
jgi:hypothetical protein